MRGIRGFEEFVAENIVKEQFPDNSRAEFLIKESERSYKNLLVLIDKIKLEDYNANMFVQHCYDIIMELVRAIMLQHGYNASGFGAHEAEVSYLGNLNFNEKEIQFVDQLRYFRNGIIYYGTALDQTYAREVIAFTKKIYPILKEKCKV